MKILKLDSSNLTEAIDCAISVLQQGGLVIYPTETCYGIGADATNQSAVDKLLAYKSRREGKPISIAVCDMDMAACYVEINDIAENLYNNYLPGPITVVSKSLRKVAKGVESEYGTLGIRIPDYPLILNIVRSLGKPVTSTSANMSYQPRPYNISKLLSEIPASQQELIDLIIDAGELPPREPSTVVDTTLNNLNIMRKGSNMLQELIKDKKAVLQANTKSAEETVSFGGMNMLKFFDIANDKPLVFMLNGELGAGKTQFAKGIATQLGIMSIIKSPTFTILNEYKYLIGQRNGFFIHVDTWRLESERDFAAINFANYLWKGNIIAIEWADKFYADLMKILEAASCKIVNVNFEYISDTERKIETYEI